MPMPHLLVGPDRLVVDDSGVETVCRESGWNTVGISGCDAFGHRFVCIAAVRDQFPCDGFDVTRCDICGQKAVQSCSLLAPRFHLWHNHSARGYVISFGKDTREIERATLEEETLPYYCSWCKVVAANAEEARIINNSRAQEALNIALKQYPSLEKFK